ncbi:unnamed protein product [Laminaria digitata]
MEHEQAVARCQENEPRGPGAANAWEACFDASREYNAFGAGV